MLNKIQLHPLLIFLIIMSIVTGTFVQLFILLCIVIVHELGHVLMAHIFKWNITSISFNIFGGVMETDEWMKRPIIQSLLVTIAGPLQHIWIFILLIGLQKTELISSTILVEASYLNVMLLLFNLLPILPLDGGRLVFYFLLLYFPYAIIYRTTIYSSILFLCLCFITYMYFYQFHLTVLLISCFIIVENYTLWKQKQFYFIRFLMWKLQTTIHTSKILYKNMKETEQIRKVTKRLHKEKDCIFLMRENIITEKQLIHAFFHPKWYHETVETYIENK